MYHCASVTGQFKYFSEGVSLLQKQTSIFRDNEMKIIICYKNVLMKRLKWRIR